jgi:hypothetical protein
LSLSGQPRSSRTGLQRTWTAAPGRIISNSRRKKDFTATGPNNLPKINLPKIIDDESNAAQNSGK